MTVAMLGVTALLLVVVVSALGLAAAVLGAHRARAAADLGALAGAVAGQAGQAPATACGQAARVVSRNGARPISCRCDPDGSCELEVAVRVRTPLPGLRSAWAHARSRAGPWPGVPLSSAGRPGP